MLTKKIKKAQEPRVYRKNGNIVIEMPEDNLVFAMENSPRLWAKIVDREKYLDAVTGQILEFTSGTDDDPLFFRVFDGVTDYLIECGDAGIEPVEPQY